MLCFTIVSTYHVNIMLSEYFVVACSLCTPGGSQTYKKHTCTIIFPSVMVPSIHLLSLSCTQRCCCLRWLVHARTFLFFFLLLSVIFTQMPRIIPQSLTSALLGFFSFHTINQVTVETLVGFHSPFCRPPSPGAGNRWDTCLCPCPFYLW